MGAVTSGNTVGTTGGMTDVAAVAAGKVGVVAAAGAVVTVGITGGHD